MNTNQVAVVSHNAANIQAANNAVNLLLPTLSGSTRLQFLINWNEAQQRANGNNVTDIMTNKRITTFIKSLLPVLPKLGKLEQDQARHFCASLVKSKDLKRKILVTGLVNFVKYT